MGVKRRLSKGRNRGKRGGGDAADAADAANAVDAADAANAANAADDANAASISLILGKYFQNSEKPSTFANLLTDIETKSALDDSADGPAGDLTILNAIKGRYSSNLAALETLYNSIGVPGVPMAIDGGSSRRRKRRRTKKTRSAKRSVKRSAKRNKARR